MTCGISESNLDLRFPSDKKNSERSEHKINLSLPVTHLLEPPIGARKQKISPLN